jgi:hypothetical protein
VGAYFRPGNVDILLNSKDCLFQGNSQIVAQIGAPPGTASLPAGTKASKKLLKDVGDTSKARKVIETAACCALNSSMAKAIISAPTRLIGKDFVGLIYFLESIIGPICFVNIRVIFARHLPVCSLKIIFRSIPADAKNFIIIAF